jgi:hypothetical protein
MREFLLLLLDRLRQWLDPDYAADLAAYQAQRKVQQGLIAAEAAALQADADQLAQLQAQRQDLETQLGTAQAVVAELDHRQMEVRNDRDQQLDDLDGTAADDLRRRPL